MNTHFSIENSNNLERSKNDTTHRNITKEEIRKLVKECLVDYTANSNLHGLKYFGEKERTTVEKLFWGFVFICSFIMCTIQIRNVWIKWQERPVIVTFSETYTPVWKIPYPAVTVCFETKSRQTEFNYTYYFKLLIKGESNFTENEVRLFNDISLMCYENIGLNIGNEYSNSSQAIKNLKQTLPKMNDVFLGCFWDRDEKNCSSLFSTILTDEGYCYTFNTLGAEEILRVDNIDTNYDYLEFANRNQSWSLEKGYYSDIPGDTYPRRGLGYGAKAGLTFYIEYMDDDIDYFCNGDGLKILLHSPDDLPRISQQYYKVPLAQEVVFAVKPKMITTSEGLRSYSPSRRQCYFSDERPLRYFKVYTQGNCEFECLTNYTFAKCDCVHFSMPHGPDMPVCKIDSSYCLERVQKELADLEFRNGLKNGDKSQIKEISQCDCLPACTSIKYEAETSQADYDINEYFKVFDYVPANGGVGLKATSVTIYFKETQFITSKRSELYGRTDFLANCGGLLGLFMGFSILSVAEIVYFSTLRFWCLLWKRRQAKHLKKTDRQTIINIE